MILVAGLAVAGLVGIAAAFYFSVRPSGSRTKGARPGRTGSGSVASTSALTGPRDDPERAAVAGRTRHGASRAPARAPGPPAEPGSGRQAPAVRASAPGVPVPAMAAGGMNGTPGVPRTASQPAALLSDPADAVEAPRSRRRVGWRKGAEVDQELWPAEAFGGITDEQFWDDLAADRPLATTARAAQPDTGSSGQPGPGSGRLPDSGSRNQPVSGSRRRPPSVVSPPDGRVSPPGPRSDWTATQPAPIAKRAAHGAGQPAEPRGLSLAGAAGSAGTGVSADEDPLTSPAYSLRPRGAVDGRSYPSSRSSRDVPREPYEAAISGGYRSDPLRPDGHWSGSPGAPGSAGTIPTPAYQRSLGSGTVAYPRPEQSYGGSSQSMSTPPYGEPYGYGDPADPAGDPRRPNGIPGYGQPGGSAAGDGHWGSRYTYPPAANYRSPYDPRGNGRR